MPEASTQAAEKVDDDQCKEAKAGGGILGGLAGAGGGALIGVKIGGTVGGVLGAGVGARLGALAGIVIGEANSPGCKEKDNGSGNVQ